MDFKRTLLWAIFTVSLLMLWDNWNKYNGKPSFFAPQPKAVATKPESASASAIANATGVPAVEGQTPAVTTNAAAEPAVKSEIITITTDLYKAKINTRGGEFVYLEMLKHKSDQDKAKNVVLFEQTNKRTFSAQTGLLSGYPNHTTVFTALPGVRDLGNSDQVQLVMQAEQGGVRLTKTYTFHKNDYVIDVRHDVANLGAQAITPSVYLQLLHDGTKPENGSMMTGNFEFYAPAVYTDAEKYQKLDFEKIEKGTATHAKSADNGWVAMLRHFFVAGFIAPEKVQREIYTKKVDTNLYAVGNIIKLGQVAPGATVTSNARLYAGPQETTRLEKVAPNFDLVKDYGLFTVIAKPVFWLMSVIHGFLGNWGWTIIVLTIIIKLAMFPLSAASFRSMAKMKLVTPKMQALRERHKDEPQKLNQAMMELYKTEKINPLGGCFPMLIQIPVFLSLYYVLQSSVEMRGAPWIGWITDLTQADPWYILPIIYMISMYITTKLNPAPADPMQAKMMLFMPLIFSVLFIFFPSGLVLYWVVNNIFSIAQQWVINNKILPPEHRT